MKKNVNLCKCVQEKFFVPFSLIMYLKFFSLKIKKWNQFYSLKLKSEEPSRLEL